ncbi:MAG: Rhomboid protease GluP [Chlamydiae bacterium]|nr:Rhomboid protease GluP [Chlamydiota bacterium]
MKRRPITTLLIAINIAFFALMMVSGVSLFAPTTTDIFLWGGSFGEAILLGQWWRLFTCMFIHIGVMHLVMNMYSLFYIGSYLEPLLGKTRFLVAYLATGLIASLMSFWWHLHSGIVGAGASGAIFGMFGVFLAFLTTKLIPKVARDALLKNIGIFVAYNLLYGLRQGVDNSAHIGGLLSGIVIGYLLYFTLIPRKKSV